MSAPLTRRTLRRDARRTLAPLHARPPRGGAAIAPLAHRRELGRLPAPAPRAGRVDPRRRLRPGHDHARLRRRASRPGRVLGIDAAAAAIEAATAEAASQRRDQRRVPHRRRVRARHRRRHLRHRARAPSAAAPRRPGRRAPRDAARLQAGRRGRGARRRLRRVHVVPGRRRSSTAWQRHVPTPSRAPTTASPTPGRFLLAWAHAAGFTDVEPGASTWCFATPEDRTWWGDLWADRMTESAVGAQAVEIGVATARRARTRWPTPGAPGPHEPDAWFAVLHGEILARA